MTESTAGYNARPCKLETCRNPAAPNSDYCTPAHRAAWHRAHAGVIPARVQSVSPTKDGARVVVVRVQPGESDRVGAWLPGRDVDLLEAAGEK